MNNIYRASAYGLDQAGHLQIISSNQSEALETVDFSGDLGRVGLGCHAGRALPLNRAVDLVLQNLHAIFANTVKYKVCSIKLYDYKNTLCSLKKQESFNSSFS